MTRDHSAPGQYCDEAAPELDDVTPPSDDVIDEK